MKIHDGLGDRMKEYEKVGVHYLTRRTPVIIRIDGCHFHTFTKGFQKPFDDILIQAMQETTKYLCENIQGCVLGYTQSDEITLVLVDYKKLTSAAWFDNRQNKMESVSASMASLAFNKSFTKIVHDKYNNGQLDDKLFKIYTRAIEQGGYFDSRAFNLPKEEVTNNIYWRQLDASRNSVNMLGQAHFSHKELQHKSCNDIQDMLMLQKGINWNDLPTYKKRGSCIVKNTFSEVISEDKDIIAITIECLRDESKSDHEWIVDLDMPQLKGDGRKYVESLINFI